MGSNNEHHYVPQFYLRHFSADQRRLNLLYLRKLKVIQNAPLRQQCARTKFYDFKPDLEKQLCDFEGQSASIIRAIVENNELPQQLDQLFHLYSFVVVQMLRGVRAANANDYMTDYYAKMLLEGRDEAKDIDLSKIEFADEYPAALPLSILPGLLPAALDLRPHLFLNASPLDFATSDDPVILHNQYCEGITHQGVTGWASKGLQVLLPLSPKHTLLLFDEAVYRVGNVRAKSSTVLAKADDVLHINALQILNAVSNVYFRSIGDAVRLEGLARRIVQDRAERPMTIVETAPIQHPDGTSSSLMHTFRALLRWKLAISAIRLRPRAQRVPLEERAGDRHQPATHQRGDVTTTYNASKIIKEHPAQYSKPLSKR